MKTNLPVLMLMVTATVLITVGLARVADDNRKGEEVIQRLPASLDSLYPPGKPAPTYFLAMQDMARSFSGMTSDIFENDLANARGNFKLFKKIYGDVAKMVPEWIPQYPLQPVENLGAALDSGQPANIMTAMEEVGKVCHHCHLTYMVPTQQKYRWEDFGEINVTDPLSGKEVSFGNLMLMMETNFAGIGADIEQGQKENALHQFDGFNARFQAMVETCMICHDSERKYYVDRKVMDIIADLQLELSKPTVEAGVVGGLMESIGKESCARCHLVHIPAAYGQQNMKGLK